MKNLLYLFAVIAVVVVGAVAAAQQARKVYRDRLFIIPILKQQYY